MKLTAIHAFRIGFPLLIACVGIGLIVSGGEMREGAGVTVVGIAVIVFVLNLFYVISANDTREREREEQARNWYAKHGRWPDE